MFDQARDDAMAIEHEATDRLANVIVTVVPALLLGVAIWLTPDRPTHRSLRSACHRANLGDVSAPASARPSWPACPADARGACFHG